MPAANGRGFGWIPNANPPALLFSAHPARANIAIPPEVFLKVPRSLDQGPLGSCTANAAAMAVAILALARGFIIWLARLSIYFGARRRLGPQYVTQDSGAMPDDALATIQAGEAGPESLRPYDVATFQRAPTLAELAAAKTHSLKKYALTGDVVLEAKIALASGFPLDHGFQIRHDHRGGLQIDHVGVDGVYPWDPTAATSNAGHSTTIVGYSDSRQAFLVCNSWGDDWGCEVPAQPERGRGCYWIPYAMFASADVGDRSAVTDWS